MEKIKCTCGWEYEIGEEENGMGWENWISCPNCDLPYKHLPYSKMEKEVVFAIEDGVRYVLFIQGEHLTEEDVTILSESLHGWWEEKIKKFYVLATGDKTIAVKLKRA